MSSLEKKMGVWCSGYDHAIHDVLAILPADLAAEVRQKLGV